MSWRALGAVVVLVATGAMASLPARSGPALLDFSAQEIARIQQHGPWPLPPGRDPGNRLSGQAAAIALGQQLFFDRRLSPDGRLSCASCHIPAKAFADGRVRSQGRVLLDRNAPSVWNAVHERWHGWDGASDSLWSQALRPLSDPRELASNAAHVARVIRQDAQLACRWVQVFGSLPQADAQVTLVDAAKALGAFGATLVSGATPFDHFRDALARGDRAAAERYPLAAQRGLRLFVGRGQCQLCHVGPMFSNGEFADIGVPFFVRPGVVDPGRHGGIQALMSSPFNLMSAWSDGPDEAALKTRHVDLQHRNFGEFKVPSLRNVADTAPYMHNGRIASLRDVVRHYSRLDLDRLHADGENILKPLLLTTRESSDLEAFLRSLSAADARRWRANPTPVCQSVP